MGLILYRPEEKLYVIGGRKNMLARQEFYCHYCDSEFLIETLSLSHLNFCPNCGAEQQQEHDEEDEDDDWDE